MKGKKFSLERLLNLTHERYRQDGRADVCKVHTGIKVDYVEEDGRTAVGVLQKSEWVDFVGVLKGGRAVAFEAKQTKLDSWKWSELKKHQRAKLELYGRMGGVAFVYLWQQGTHKLIPWNEIPRGGAVRPGDFMNWALPPGKSWLDVFA